MLIGDLVRNIFTEELGLITRFDNQEYVEIDGRWLVPMSHLEVVFEGR